MVPELDFNAAVIYKQDSVLIHEVKNKLHEDGSVIIIIVNVLI